MIERKTLQLRDIMPQRTGAINPVNHPEEIFDLFSISAHDYGRPESVMGSKIGSTKQIVQEGDVLLSKIVPHIRRCWVVGPSTGKRQIASGEWIIFRSPKVHNEYLRQLLLSDAFHRQFMATVSGVGGSLMRARPAVLANIRISLPPVDEQKHVADILGVADGIRRKRRESLLKAEQFMRSMFLEMFGDPVRNTKGWPTDRMGNVCEFYAGNSLPDGEPYLGQSHGLLHLKVGDMNLPGNEDIISTAREWSNFSSGGIVAPSGSVLVPKRGGAIATNKKRILSRPCALDPNLMAIFPKQPLNTDYLFAWFSLFDLATITSGSAVPQLNKGDLAPLTIQIPSKPLLEKFSVAVKRVKNLNSGIKAHKRQAEILFSALQQSSFA